MLMVLFHQWIEIYIPYITHDKAQFLIFFIRDINLYTINISV